MKIENQIEKIIWKHYHDNGLTAGYLHPATLAEDINDIPVIAAAPELLKAAIVGLIHMEDVSKAYPIPRSIPQSEIDFVKQAIAKAEGE